MSLSPDNLRHFLEPFFEQLIMLQDDLNKAEHTGGLLPQCEFWLAQLHDELEIKNQEIKIFLSSTNKIDDKIDFIQIWLEVILPEEKNIKILLQKNNNPFTQKLISSFNQLSSFEGVPYVLYLTATISNLSDILMPIYHFEGDGEPGFSPLNTYQIELNNLLARVKRELVQIDDEFENLYRFYLPIRQALYLDLRSELSRLTVVSQLAEDHLEEIFTLSTNLFQLEQIKEISAQTDQLRQLIEDSWRKPELIVPNWHKPI